MFYLCHQRFATLSCQNENCRTDTSTAALNGHIECLKYSHLHGCPWHPYTTYYAARYGHSECLKYAYENDCPWHPDTTLIAAANGHLECLKYIFENCNIRWEDTNLEEKITFFFKRNSRIS